MREIKVFKFSELSEEARHYAYEHRMVYSLQDEVYDILEDFSILASFTYGGNYNSGFYVDEIGNEYARNLHNQQDVKRYVETYIAPILKSSGYKWTMPGHFGDDKGILTPIIDCLTGNEQYESYFGLLSDCLISFLKDYYKYLEWVNSYEGFCEEELAKDSEYFENGKFYE